MTQIERGCLACTKAVTPDLSSCCAREFIALFGLPPSADKSHFFEFLTVNYRKALGPSMRSPFSQCSLRSYAISHSGYRNAEFAAESPNAFASRQSPLQFGALKRRWFFISFLLVLLVAVLVVHIDWTWKRQLSPRGGRYFFNRVELAVPSFRQSDEKWRDDPLGGIEANGTLRGEGCAVAAAAMVFKFYGVEIDPQQLNWFLTSVDGYTENGWIYWDRAVWFAPDRVRHLYEDLASYQLIDSNLAHGNPVIVRVRLRNGVTHFVVIAGKNGFDYLVRDPGRGSAKGLYPLRELGSDIAGSRV